MQYFVIADEDTVLGFRFAGVRGRAVTSAAEARAALAEQVEAGDVGVIILTDEVAQTIEDEVNRMRFESTMPLVVQIPGPTGPAENRPDLTALIREAMGVRV
jgi:V/A-type H+-transporting ATPase subunit F